ncbi:TIGR03118 family protein [Streptomyces sp. NBC_00873]|uniref:TIGR03118 family protein n=1 Tax=unclassified Streptomyces TaxID=2593676 RepID=UPI003870C001|nr:TIGR03118 family protein [Streptomyces sp. NBC_00873]WSY96756.1 TIGR03118 family protein [Streptomyces sp. NBC_00873]WTA41470.1 TIGR03118 family protein [Streptomyces sp. NBC_00842]WTA48426.1 TIGR03118 family protein [Streptomyces sp. NBC_00842]
MAQHVSACRPRPLRRRLTAAALALGTVGALAAAAPPGSGESPHGADHGFRERDLVSDIPGRAEATDGNLVNPWGLAAARTGEVWASDNGMDKATMYSGAVRGKPVNILDLVVSIPEGGAPTGIVRNDTDDFRFSGFGKSGVAQFLFAGENGDLFAWSPDVNLTNAVQVAHENSDGENAVFKGLTLIPAKKKHSRACAQRGKTAGNDKRSRLLVANFRDARIDVFDKDFNLLPPDDRFQDPNIPDGFAPFDVKKIGSRVFVTYAKQDEDKKDDVPGAGNGFIDTFSTEGKLLKRFASRGVLNSPWGLEIAPKKFGKFSGDLLVGNFGDGHINVFNPNSGKFKGTLRDRKGNAIEIPGLWGLLRGTQKSGGKDSVWFAAGIEGEAHGLLGTLRAED